MPRTPKFLFFAPFFFQIIFLANGQVQKAGIETGPTTLGLNQQFTITINYPSDQTFSVTFPEIKGLSKAGTSSSTSTVITNGNINTTQSITQRYGASKEGSYVLKPFKITVENKTFNHPGATIVFSDKAGQQAQGNRQGPAPYDPFEDFFNRGRDRGYADAKPDAFLTLSSNKREVYVGEEFNIKLSLLVAEDNRADMDFYELPSQLSAIIKKIKPANCWEENFGIVEVLPVQVRIGKKVYNEYKIWQASFFPFNSQDIEFPQIGLNLMRLKGGRDPFFGTLNPERELKRFITRPFKVAVNDLPPSPLRGRVAVGDYKLQERITKNRLNVSESVVYEFQIRGSGNISDVSLKIPEQTASLDVYPPTVSQQIVRERNQVFGRKVFGFLLQPKTEGKISLAQEGFRWPFFNTRTGRYDSLVSRISMVVSPSSEMASRQRKQSDPSLVYTDRQILLDQNEALKVVGNAIILIMAVTMGGILLYRKK